MTSNTPFRIQPAFLVILVLFFACNQKKEEKKQNSHAEMIAILKQTHQKVQAPLNPFTPGAGIPYVDSLMHLPNLDHDQIMHFMHIKGNLLLELGQEDQAIVVLEEALKDDRSYEYSEIWKELALAYFRKGERVNCISNHASESCILPIKGLGLHTNIEGSTRAVEIYQNLVTKDNADIESGYILNLAYMTLGQYPKGVPRKFLIPGLEGDTTYKVKPFTDVAADLQLDVKNMAGGSVVDDFDNDGYLDVFTTGWGTDEAMHFFKNNADGTFVDRSASTGLEGIVGGLNMVQADYNNDGFVDIFVLRGAWKREYGREPNSLLRNNGDGTFTDVTIQAGLLSFHPTQTATWNDFNNDGWLDLFIGNETFDDKSPKHPCELYMSNGDGTFQEVAQQAHVNFVRFVKGVTSGDFDHDGWKDIFISTMGGQQALLRNLGNPNGKTEFEDVTASANLLKQSGNTFPTWFWDYDNDGWLDIFACDYTFDRPLAFYAAAEKLKMAEGSPYKTLLYHNNQDGTFTNVTNEMDMNKVVFAMGSNFGDINNDGFLDMYLGSGNPSFRSIVPNKMFMNLEGRKFADVTNAARVGHLQKGHGVSFADLDNDGDQDIYCDMGGAFPGDSYQNAFFLNPGQAPDNHWISLRLIGGKGTNRSAIGTSIDITFRENGKTRHVYRDVNSGGSFGCSPLRREIGLGKAEMIDDIKVTWHGSGVVQHFKDVKPDQFLKITEGHDTPEKVELKKITWTLPNLLCRPDGTYTAANKLK